MEYGGWTNYETWAVFHRFTGEPASAANWNEKAARISEKFCSISAAAETTQFATFDASIVECEGKARDALANVLKDEALDNIEIESGLHRDLLVHALGRVNWHEVARHMLEGLE